MKRFIAAMKIKKVHEFISIWDFKYEGRIIILHFNYHYNPEYFLQEFDYKYTVSDYATGMAICQGNNKKELIKLAKDRVKIMNEHKGLSEWSDYPILNSDLL